MFDRFLESGAVRAATASIAIGLLALAGVSPARAREPEDDSADLAKEVEALKEGQAEIRKELSEIKRLLKTRPAQAAPAARRGPDVKGVVFDLGDNPVKGVATAKLTLVEFTDYQ